MQLLGQSPRAENACAWPAPAATHQSLVLRLHLPGGYYLPYAPVIVLIGVRDACDGSRRVFGRVDRFRRVRKPRPTRGALRGSHVSASS